MRALFIEHDHISLGGPIWRSLEKHGYEIERFLIVPKENYDSPNVTTTLPNFNEYDLLVPMGAPYGAYEDDRIGNWLLSFRLHSIKVFFAPGIYRPIPSVQDFLATSFEWPGCPSIYFR